MANMDVERESFLRRIYDINEKDFEGVAIKLFQYQYAHNPLYHDYCRLVRRTPENVRRLADIPYIPITFFKEHEIKTGAWKEEAIFRSSGTTGTFPSQHFIRERGLYHHIAKTCFEVFFGPQQSFTWLGLLPSYLERPDSSLIDMVNAFMEKGTGLHDGFYKQGDELLLEKLKALQTSSAHVMLIGVSFALLDFFMSYDVPVWKGLTVIETGGMKGRGQELTRDELYALLRLHHPELKIVSEYGMTELISQAYRTEDIFIPGPTMRVIIRDISDPFEILGFHQRGGINIVDLGNIDTCAFIATDDAGISYPGGGFDVLGRLDASDLRGCNLMYTSS